MGQLDGRAACITGAGDGIGAGFARVFAAEGAKVVIGEINEATGQAMADELGDSASFIPTDAGDREQCEAMVQHTVDTFGKIDILINNAWGGGRICRVENKTEELIAGGLDVGFRGPLWTMIAAHKHMAPAGYGRIINMCSLNGVNAHMGTLEYNSAKEALRAASRTAAREWADTGITVNVICPAAISASFKAVMAQNPELVATAGASNPMGRMGDPDEDIAPVALFLASEGSRYMTGNTLFVDGGGHINGSSWKPDLE
ncbi:MAG: SDR family NAD(P)-dependent oxidoreductase [Acidimicrobiales bacterium]|jgi:NAD(P)-dependent dehydrogenase (short-subunit alcohol dehydrogenase family)|nr:SDR family NAD(P)-dependent oxidoreductase [Acidimicrobiales bacterium]